VEVHIPEAISDLVSATNHISLGSRIAMAQEQEPQLQENMLNSKDKQPKPRHRASVACCACRERRTRCVISPGASQCTACEAAGQQCLIKNDDERRKPNSKAYVNGLRDRIAQLESMLEEKEQRNLQQQSPVSQQAASGPQDVANRQEQLRSINTDSFDFAIPLLPHMEFPDITQQDIDLDAHSPANSVQSSSSSTRSTMVHRLLSTKGHLSFDQLSGRLRYYGPTTNCHIHSELAAENEEHNRQAVEQRRRTQRVLSTLPQDTQEYLMQMFWQYYNSVIHVIHRDAFEEGLSAGQGQFYSPFLHICILGIGYRHADKSRPDIMKISLPGKESTLHREAKYMLDYELERPGGITSIQALLLLGDLECGVGRDNLGWLISGMANRLCFDVGLHLDTSASGLSQLEVEIGRMTLWACVIYDRYWALFLGRPTALKPEDLEVYRLAAQFERLGTLEPAGPSSNLEKQIYEALLDLMELAGKITEIMDKATKPNARLDHHVYITMAALDRELETWYTRLPHPLQWTAENIDGAPFSYFLLHQQYHAAMILLHRQFAQYDDFVPSSSDQGSESGEHSQASSHFATLSRMTCTRSAGRIAQIFWQHRKHFPTSKIFVTGLQHAGTAAIALVAAIASPKDRVSYDTNMKYLECLAASIEDMCETYQPAERMSTVLNAVLLELRVARPPKPYASRVPARRGSSADRDTESDPNPAKRHQAGRPSAQRTNSQVSQPRMLIYEHHRRHTTTGMRPPVIPPSKPRRDNQKEPSHLSSGSDNFILVPEDPDTEDLSNDWPKFDETNPFTIDETMLMSGFGRPMSPSRFRSVWMGAETPAFSPIPTSSTHQSQNIFTSNTNLDFMSLLNTCEDNNHGNDALHGTSNHNHNQHADGDQAASNNQFASLPTPTSQPTPNDAPSKSTTTLHPPQSASRSHSQQRPANQSSGITQKPSGGDRGLSQTMAGLDDIWKEMMRSNQNSATTGKR